MLGGAAQKDREFRLKVLATALENPQLKNGCARQQEKLKHG